MEIFAEIKMNICAVMWNTANRIEQHPICGSNWWKVNESIRGIIAQIFIKILPNSNDIRCEILKIIDINKIFLSFRVDKRDNSINIWRNYIEIYVTGYNVSGYKPHSKDKITKCRFCVQDLILIFMITLIDDIYDSSQDFLVKGL